MEGFKLVRSDSSWGLWFIWRVGNDLLCGPQNLAWRASRMQVWVKYFWIWTVTN